MVDFPTLGRPTTAMVGSFAFDFSFEGASLVPGAVSAAALPA
jgi:hypothetical protein